MVPEMAVPKKVSTVEKNRYKKNHLVPAPHRKSMETIKASMVSSSLRFRSSAPSLKDTTGCTEQVWHGPWCVNRTYGDARAQILSKLLILGRFELSWPRPPANVVPIQMFKRSSQLQKLELEAQNGFYELVITCARAVYKLKF